MSRCVFVFCDALEKGFVTRLSPEQRIDLIHKQIDEVLLTGTDYELINVEFSDKVIPGRWILPPFLRLKDLHFEAPVYTKAIVRKKAIGEGLPLPEPLTSPGLETPEQTELKDNTADEDNLAEVSETTKPPTSPRKRAETKRRSKASSPRVKTKKTKTEKTAEKIQCSKDNKTEQTPKEKASESQEIADNQDMESPSLTNT